MLSLAGLAIANSAGHKVAGATFTTPAVTGATITSIPGGSQTYARGEAITVRITFSRPVAVSGAPQLALTIGANQRQASYTAGTGTASLTFSYTVQATDSDPNGIEVAASALTLNAGTINDVRDATAATLGLGSHAIATASGHKVDGTTITATVNSVTITSAPASGDTYAGAETITVQVGFTGTVTVTGSPQLALTIGMNTRQAAYASGTGSTTLTFSYRTMAADLDSDGIGIAADALTLNGGAIRTASAANAGLSLGSHAIANAGSHKVDGTTTAPVVDSVAITSTPARGDTYGAGETITIEVGFSLAVTVTSDPGAIPTQAMDMGTLTPAARYASGSGTRTLVFNYVVLATDTDPDGIGVLAGGLWLNGARIRSATGVNAVQDLGSHAIANAAGHKVNGAATVPTVSSVDITSTPSSTAQGYKANEAILVQVGFTIPVLVTGSPQLALRIGTQTRQAEYLSGSGTSILAFRYLVLRADRDADGIEIQASALTLNSGTIRSGAGTNANLALGSHAVATASAHKVDGRNVAAPSVTRLTITSRPIVGDAYGLGETITVEVEFSVAVTVTGTPHLVISLPSKERANYTSGSGTRALTFSYTVAAVDEDANGISIGSNALKAENSARIVDAGGSENAELRYSQEIVDASGHKVDGKTDNRSRAVTVSSVTISSTPASASTYAAGETIAVQVVFGSSVTVTGRPRLALTIGSCHPLRHLPRAAPAPPR